jgi:hypothetical protein
MAMRNAAQWHVTARSVGLALGVLGILVLPAACSDDSDLATGGDGGPPAASTLTPTWHQHVAPLVSARCSGCHRPDGIGPFSLLSYDTARPFAAAMAAATASGKMPPWHALETDECRPRYKWKADQRLTPDEKTILQRWAATGAPEGTAAGAPALPPPPATTLADPTRRVSMAAPFTLPAASKDVFRCFPLDHQFEADSWITGLQVVPGNAKVVHHVLVWLDKDGEGLRRAGTEGSYTCFGAPGFQTALLGAWAPGAGPIEPPAGSGLRIPKGARIIMNVHYHPGAEAATDTSGIDLRWTTEPPAMEVQLGLPGNARTAAAGLLPGPSDPAEGPAFIIPAGAKGHEEQMAIPLNPSAPVRVFSVGTHMHYVGTGMKMEVDRSARAGGPPADEPARECLIETPHWDFHWQRGYSYDTDVTSLPTVARGDLIRLRCLYDNSMDNPFVASALREQGLPSPREVRIGEQTLDEMCLGILGVVYPRRP